MDKSYCVHMNQGYTDDPLLTLWPLPGNSATTFSAHKEVKSNGAEKVFQEEQFDEFFPGFLAIGTLGNYQTTINTDDPPTPTFPMPFEHVETDSCITEKELKFINDELEKFLEEKVNEEVAYQPSERTIALSDHKHIETGATGNMEECPLQKYLLGSSVIELQEIQSEVNVELCDYPKLIIYLIIYVVTCASSF